MLARKLGRWHPELPGGGTGPTKKPALLQGWLSLSFYSHLLVRRLALPPRCRNRPAQEDYRHDTDQDNQQRGQ